MMMTVLLESAGAPGPRRTGWTAASLIMHAALIACAVELTTRAPGLRPERPGNEPRPVYIPVRDVRAQPQPRTDASRPSLPDPTRITIAAPVVPTIDPALPFSSPALRIGEVFGSRSSSGIINEGGTPAGDVHTTATVERLAAPRADNGQPEYPRPLRNAGVEGEVLVTFVVDTAGRAEPGSITILSATHPLFADAVRRWLSRTRYTPAQIGGRAVRQLVQQTVGFTLTR